MDDDGLLIFDERIGQGIPDGVNTLIYTIIKHFVETPSNISSRISDYLNNLRCPTMSDYSWYQDVFIFKVMLIYIYIYIFFDTLYNNMRTHKKLKNNNKKQEGGYEF